MALVILLDLVNLLIYDFMLNLKWLKIPLIFIFWFAIVVTFILMYLASWFCYCVAARSSTI